MSDRTTARKTSAGDLSVTGADVDLPEVIRPTPLAVLLLDAATGEVLTASAAARRWLSSVAAAPLTAWLSDVARVPATRPDLTDVHTWGGPDTPDGSRAVLSAQCTPVTSRGRECRLVVLRDSLAPTSGRSGCDATLAAFLLDAIGRVESWSPAAGRLTGFGPEHTLGSDGGVLHPTPARLAGDPHRALAEASRSGEHRAEGWRQRADGTLLWAESTTSALYDAHDRVVGYAVLLADRTDTRRLRAVPARRVLPQGRVTVTLPDAGRRPGPRVPSQRRPGAR